MRRIYSYKKTFTPSGGSHSFNTQEFRGEVCVLQIKPTTSTTRYTVTITNDDGVIVYRESHTGNLLDERTRHWYGIYTVAITAATADEEFNLEIDYVDLQ